MTSVAQDYNKQHIITECIDRLSIYPYDEYMWDYAILPYCRNLNVNVTIDLMVNSWINTCSELYQKAYDERIKHIDELQPLVQTIIFLNDCPLQFLEILYAMSYQILNVEFRLKTHEIMLLTNIQDIKDFLTSFMGG